MATTEKNSVAG